MFPVRLKHFWITNHLIFEYILRILFQKKYNEFPLAKELQALKLEWKKKNIEKRTLMMLLADSKRQQKLRNEITGIMAIGLLFIR